MPGHLQTIFNYKHQAIPKKLGGLGIKTGHLRQSRETIIVANQ